MAADLDKVREIVQRVAESSGLEVVDVEFRVGGKARMLRIFIDKYLVEVFANDRQAMIASYADYGGKPDLNVVTVGAPTTLKKIEPNLQSIGSNMYGPPQNVQATRNGDEVTITWDQMQMTADKDRGYLIEAFVCQGGAYIWWTFSYPDQFETSYTVTDEAGCAAPSSGKIYTVEKHGFSQPAEIPWPAP